MEVINFKNRKYFSSELNIVNSKKGIIIIDAGFYNEEIKEYLKKIGKVDAILLTHGHFDHIQALDEIKKDYPTAKIYIHKNDYNFLKDENLNLSIKHGVPFIINSEVEMLDDGIFNIGAYEVQVIHTPGHTGGSVLYYFKDEKIIFTGDTIGPLVIGNSYYPTGSDNDMFNSLNKFKNLNISKDTMCYSGHWGNATYEEILKINPYLNV